MAGLQTSAKLCFALVFTAAVGRAQAFGFNPDAPPAPQQLTYFCADPDVEAAFVNAIGTWNAALDGYFTVSKADTPFNAYIVLFRTEVTTGELGGETGFVHGGYVFININPTQATLFALNAVVLHEVGHALGLAHSVYPDAIMNARIDPTRAPVLSYDDVAGIRTLYGLAPPAFDTLQITIDRSDRRWNGRGGRYRFVLSGAFGDFAMWDFGDGTRGYGRTVTHRFPMRGTYRVTVSSLMFSGELSVTVK